MMDSLAAWGAAPISFRLVRRAFMAAVLAPALSGCIETLSLDVSPPALQGVPEVNRISCPSQNFPEFLDAFGESIEIQKEYTHIPLVYGRLNAGLNGTSTENVTTQQIDSFDAIPIYDAKDGGRILRNKVRRRERGLIIRVEPDREDSQDKKIVTVLLPHTRFHLEYQFARTEACWELARIDDLTK